MLHQARTLQVTRINVATLGAGPFARVSYKGYRYMYSAELLDHFEHPRNSGELPGADARVTTQNPACGDILELAVKVSAGRISEIRFRVKGCVPAIACASAITELAAGKSFQEAASITRNDVVRAVGSLPPASGHAAHLAVEALKAVLQRYEGR